jgi:hypothetical protein
MTQNGGKGERTDVPLTLSANSLKWGPLSAWTSACKQARIQQEGRRQRRQAAPVPAPRCPAAGGTPPPGSMAVQSRGHTTSGQYWNGNGWGSLALACRASESIPAITRSRGLC